MFYTSLNASSLFTSRYLSLAHRHFLSSFSPSPPSLPPSLHHALSSFVSYRLPPFSYSSGSSILCHPYNQLPQFISSLAFLVNPFLSPPGHLSSNAYKSAGSGRRRATLARELAKCFQPLSQLGVGIRCRHAAQNTTLGRLRPRHGRGLQRRQSAYRRRYRRASPGIGIFDYGHP